MRRPSAARLRFLTRIRQYIVENKETRAERAQKSCASAASEANFRLEALSHCGNDATFRMTPDRTPPSLRRRRRANLDTPLPVARAFTLFWVYPSDEVSLPQYKVTFVLLGPIRY